MPNNTGIAFANEPHIRKQLLLAPQTQCMLVDGRAMNLSQLAKWLNKTKARLQQLQHILFLAPNIQEDILTAK